MLQRVQTVLQAECRLDWERPVLVGVSGGPDSLCLMDVLNRLGVPLVVAHLNHGLRAEAEGEARRVGQAARILNLPFVQGRQDVGEFARENSLSVEESARLVRYRFLFEEAARSGAQAVAVGHTADDQVETVLMHFLRGAGLSGLRGMAYRSLPSTWSEEIPLVRPLLGIWREEVLAYISERGLRPAFDASNLDTSYYRNRLRHELIPFLQDYNPQVKQRLWTMAQVLSADYDVLAEEIEAAWESCEMDQSAGTVTFSRSGLLAQPQGLQRQLLRRAVSLLRPGLRDLDFQAVERGLACLASQATRTQCDLVAGLRLFVEDDRVGVTEQAGFPLDPNWPQLPAGVTYNLQVPGILHLTGGWVIRAALAHDPEAARRQALANGDPYQAWFSAGELRLPLRVRARRPGDRFRPIGMEGHSMKLSDFMINVRLPQPARPGWPLVISGEEIAWVPGYRLADPFQVRPDTLDIVHLRMEVVE